jgi:tetratricopeptide (TPR) repeat protein
MISLRTILYELQRRRVFRVAAIYAAAAFAVAQGADIAFPVLGLPPWMLNVVVILSIVGFPVALVLAWAFDITPQGVVRTPDEAVRPAGARLRVGRLAAAGAVVLLAAAGGIFMVQSEDGPPLLPQRVVVAPFENRTGDPALDPVGSMAADWITQGISQTALVDVVQVNTALRSARFVQEQHAQEAAAERHLLRALAEETGAGLVVSGAYYLQGDSLRFQAQITDTRSGRLLRGLPPVTGLASAPIDAIEDVRRRVLGGLALLLDPRLQAHAQVASNPPSYEAFQAFAAGRAHFIARDWRKAIADFERVSALDSTYTLPLLLRAVAYANLGQDAQADSIARILEARSGTLAPYDRAVLDLVSAWLRSDRVAAYLAAQRAARLAPMSSTAVQPAFEALRLNRPGEAVEILAALDPTRGELRGWSFYWDVLTRAHHVLGEHRAELKAAQRGRALYPDDPQYLAYEARALVGLGRFSEIEPLLEARLRMGEDASPTVGALMFTVAGELRAHGQPEAAQRLFDRALAWYELQPTEQRTGRNRYRWAMNLYTAGRLQDALVILDELLREDPQDLRVHGRLAMIAARSGHHAEAERIAEWLASQHSPFVRGRPTAWRARIAAQLGQSEKAVALLRQGHAQGNAFGIEYHTDPDLERLRGHAGYQELVRPGSWREGGQRP